MDIKNRRITRSIAFSEYDLQLLEKLENRMGESRSSIIRRAVLEFYLNHYTKEKQ
jgi:hypothetical protein